MGELIFLQILPSLTASAVLIGTGIAAGKWWKEHKDVEKIWAAIDEISEEKNLNSKSEIVSGKKLLFNNN